MLSQPALILIKIAFFFLKRYDKLDPIVKDEIKQGLVQGACGLSSAAVGLSSASASYIVQSFDKDVREERRIKAEERRRERISFFNKLTEYFNKNIILIGMLEVSHVLGLILIMIFSPDFMWFLFYLFLLISLLSIIDIIALYFFLIGFSNYKKNNNDAQKTGQIFYIQ